MTSHEMAEEPVVNYDYFLDTYGLGPEEVNATLQFGRYQGTVAEMLEDSRCPVGAAVADAYGKEGLQGVESKLEALQSIFGDFALTVGEQTRSYHEGKTDRERLLSVAAGESPDFLA